MVNAERFLAFLEEALKLKEEPRKGWRRRLGLGEAECESVAEHSYSLALMAMLWADAKGLNAERALRLALLHDLAEAVVGDITPSDEKWEEKERLEGEGIRELLALLPSSMASGYLELWEDWVLGISEEARLVKELDKVEMALQAYRYATKGYPAHRLEEFLRSAEGAVREGSCKSFLYLLKERWRVTPSR